MKSHYLLLLLLLLCSLPVIAQDNDEINTIKVKKKPVVMPDTGRYRGPAQAVSDWGPRPWGCDPPNFFREPRLHFFVGYEYFNYSYFRAGVHSAKPNRFITAYGVGVEACVDHEIYGVGAFARRNVLELKSSSFSLGAHGGAYFSPNNSFYIASPTITYVAFGCLKSIQLSYGYNFMLASKARNATDLNVIPAPKVNTHNFSLVYILPFYL